MDITEFMMWKFAILGVLAFLYGLLGGRIDR